MKLDFPHKLNFHSIKFRVWLYFIVFTLSVVFLLWLLQIVFLNVYYENMRISSILRAAANVSRLYNSADTQNLESGIDRIAYQNDLNIQIIDMNSQCVYSAAMNKLAFSPLQLPIDAQTLRSEILSQPNQRMMTRFPFAVDNRQMLLYGQVIENRAGESAVLLISSSLEPLSATIAILKDQLMYVTIVVVIMSMILSAFIALRISRPIAEITKSARHLATGNYRSNTSLSDYTEIVQLGKALDYASQEIARSERLRRDIIANVSHDLRTPLTMIKAYAEMIRDLSGGISERRNEHLAVIIDETDRLVQLVQDILELSKLQSGQTKLNMARFDINAKIKSVIERYMPLTGQGYTFVFENAAEKIMVSADESKIEQVLHNLIGNAINHTGADKRVTIRVGANAQAVRTEVSDTGEGIAEEHQAHIWDRYYRVGSKASPLGGTGLGLYIVKGILEAHGARFGVDSAPGRGSTFWFELTPAP